MSALFWIVFWVGTWTIGPVALMLCWLAVRVALDEVRAWRAWRASRRRVPAPWEAFWTDPAAPKEPAR